MKAVMAIDGLVGSLATGGVISMIFRPAKNGPGRAVVHNSLPQRQMLGY